MDDTSNQGLMAPSWDNGVVRLYHADARRIPLPDESVHCVVTSPPYWSLRDYGLEPSVWGGDPDCPHYWGNGVVAPGARSGDGKSGSKQRKANRRDRMAPSAFCGECGAWLGTLGLEPTVNLYVAHIVEIFREVWRVLRKDGTCWINLGDSYAGSGKGWGTTPTQRSSRAWNVPRGSILARPPGYIQGEQSDGLKPKDLVGMAWRVAFALQDDGWWLRSPVIWDKPNPMPESVADRLTTSHEYVFMLAKSGDRLYWAHPDRPGSRVKPAPDYRYVCDDTGEVVEVSPEGWRAKDFGWRRVNLWQGHDYFFDGYAIREPLAEASVARISQATFWKQQGGEKDYRNGVNPARSTRRSLENLARRTPSGWNVNHDEPNLLGRYGQREEKQRGHRRPHQGFIDRWNDMTTAEQRSRGANARTVWRIAARPYRDKHYATFPEELPRRCILAGTSEYGVCAQCGAPWERVVDVKYDNPGNRTTNGPRSLAQRDETAGFTHRLERSTNTTGWQSTCACDADVVPATVLDPFVGSGTTAAVAQRLGRRAVGVDASTEYLALATERVGAVSLPLPLGGGP